MGKLIFGSGRTTAGRGLNALVPWSMSLFATMLLSASAHSRTAASTHGGPPAEERLAQAKRLMDADPDSALVLARDVADHLSELGSAEE